MGDSTGDTEALMQQAISPPTHIKALKPTKLFIK